MEMKIVENYMDELIERSTLDAPAWNIEAKRGNGKSLWNYVDGCMIMAILEYYDITKDKKYLEFADAYIGHRVNEDGTIEGFKIDAFNIDSVNAGKTLFHLYDLTGKEKYRKAIDLIYKQVLLQPRTKEGSFWHKLIYPQQVWLDGLYMGQPFYMEYETRFNDKKNYADIYNQFANVVRFMKDEKTGLYYHAYDSSKTMFWCDKETGLSDHFWLRAIGWYSMALLDTYCIADPGVMGEEREELKKTFIDLMETMVRYQDETGMWYQIVDLVDREPNYLETSGSAIMAYCMLKGVRYGVLPEEYREYAKKAFRGICDKYLITKDGEMHLGGIVLVGGVGGPTMRRGDFDYYMSEPVVEDDAKGVGPFLLAYTELRRL